MISIKSIAFIDDQLASGEVPVRPEDAAFTQQPTTAGADRPGPFAAAGAPRTSRPGMNLIEIMRFLW
jgi:hypothetical protein